MLRIEGNRRSFLAENPEGKSQRKIFMDVHQEFSCFNGF